MTETPEKGTSVAVKKRETGIKVLGPVPWGTHICVFYDTGKDLVDILVPFFVTGLQNNELCIWFYADTSTGEEVAKAMTEEMADFNRYKESGQIEIIPYTEMYLKDKAFDGQQALNFATAKLARSLERNFDGTRAASDISWLDKEDRAKFSKYETRLNQALRLAPGIALCAYPLDEFMASDFIKIVSSHKYVFVARGAKLARLGDYRYRKAWEAITRSQKSYRSVVPSLKEEMRESEDKFLKTFHISPDAVFITTLTDRKVFDINDSFTRVFGYTHDEIIGRSTAELNPWLNQDQREKIVKTLVTQGRIQNEDGLFRKKSGEIRVAKYSSELINIGGEPYLITAMTDITERKREEESRRMLLNPTPDNPLTRLQERFIYTGFQGFSDQEIIELFLSLTLPEPTAGELAEKCIAEFHNLGDFLAAPVEQLRHLGIPQSNIVGLKMIHGLPAQILSQRIKEQPEYKSPHDIADFLYYSMRDLKKEVFKAIHLNNRNQIEEIIDLFEGEPDRIAINPRQVMESAIEHNTRALIFVHNHPSGDPTPSPDDVALTRAILQAGKLLDIDLLDHLVIGAGRYVSLKERGLGFS